MPCLEERGKVPEYEDASKSAVGNVAGRKSEVNAMQSPLPHQRRQPMKPMSGSKKEDGKNSQLCCVHPKTTAQYSHKTNLPQAFTSVDFKPGLSLGQDISNIELHELNKSNKGYNKDVPFGEWAVGIVLAGVIPEPKSKVKKMPHFTDWAPSIVFNGIGKYRKKTLQSSQNTECFCSFSDDIRREKAILYRQTEAASQADNRGAASPKKLSQTMHQTGHRCDTGLQSEKSLNLSQVASSADDDDSVSCEKSNEQSMSISQNPSQASEGLERCEKSAHVSETAPALAKVSVRDSGSVTLNKSLLSKSATISESSMDFKALPRASPARNPLSPAEFPDSQTMGRSIGDLDINPDDPSLPLSCSSIDLMGKSVGDTEFAYHESTAFVPPDSANSKPKNLNTDLRERSNTDLRERSCGDIESNCKESSPSPPFKSRQRNEPQHEVVSKPDLANVVERESDVKVTQSLLSQQREQTAKSLPGDKKEDGKNSQLDLPLASTAQEHHKTNLSLGFTSADNCASLLPEQRSESNYELGHNREDGENNQPDDVPLTTAAQGHQQTDYSKSQFSAVASSSMFDLNAEPVEKPLRNLELSHNENYSPAPVEALQCEDRSKPQLVDVFLRESAISIDPPVKALQCEDRSNLLIKKDDDTNIQPNCLFHANSASQKRCKKTGVPLKKETRKHELIDENPPKHCRTPSKLGYTLPTIITASVVKKHVEDRVGMVFSDTKNGRIVITKMASNSLFRDTELDINHEMLLVNGHRLKSAKIAATLIKMSKGKLIITAFKDSRPKESKVEMLRLSSSDCEDIRFATKNNMVHIVRADGRFSKCDKMKTGDICLSINGIPIDSAEMASELVWSSQENAHSQNIAQRGLVIMVVFSLSQLRRRLIRKISVNLPLKWNDNFDVCTFALPTGNIYHALRIYPDGRCEVSFESQDATIQNILKVYASRFNSKFKESTSELSRVIRH